MRNALFATASLAFVSSPAMAADMMSVGVGGYMEQWFGYANRDDKDAKGMSEEGGWDAQGDAEIHFRGSLESDSGLKFTVHVEVEGDRSNSDPGHAIDESYARVSGGFGQIEFGARDHAMVRMHQGISDVGIGLNAGDTQKWIPGAYLETSGHAMGNARKLNYITPRVSGVQIGVSYAPDDSSQGPTSAPSSNDNAGWGVGMNFKQDVGDMAVTFSLGHANRGMAAKAIKYKTGKVVEDGDNTGVYFTPNSLAAEKAKLGPKVADILVPGKTPTTMALTDAIDAQARIDKAHDGSMMKGDDSTYTNAGVGVSFGAFKFNVAYATADGGAFTTKDGMRPWTAADVASHNAVDGNNDVTLNADGTITEADHAGAFGEGITDETTAEAQGSNNDEGNDYILTQSVVEDTTKNYDVWGASISYTDGPMSVSLGHMTHEEEAGGERTATMFSAGYALAPGVSWRTSIFTVEDDTSHKNVTGDMNEGTGFVTGIKIGF